MKEASGRDDSTVGVLLVAAETATIGSGIRGASRS